ncbi:MAG: transcription elongation factor GreA [Bacteroidota bacterium]|nr:transcription elongation factor GreA [Bacteroidota bacterium]
MEPGGTTYLTRERLRELEQELHEMKTKGRAEIAAKIAEARSHGDLMENAEYDAAKEEQNLFEMRIKKLEQILARARVIDSKDLPNDAVYILSNVTLENMNTGERVTYTLVSADEADFERNKLSVTSPVGKALLKKKVGDHVKIVVPAGTIEYRILEITR